MTEAPPLSKGSDADQVRVVCDSLDWIAGELTLTVKGEANGERRDRYLSLAQSVRAEVRAVRLALASGKPLRRLTRRCVRFAARFNRQADRLGLLTDDDRAEIQRIKQDPSAEGV